VPGAYDSTCSWNGEGRCAFLALSPLGLACSGVSTSTAQPPASGPVSRAGTPPPPIGERLVLDDAAWRARLTRGQYEILRRQGTEPAFSGAYWNEHRAGAYLCAGCGAPLFDAAAKFDSGTGWPSFHSPVEAAGVHGDLLRGAASPGAAPLSAPERP